VQLFLTPLTCLHGVVYFCKVDNVELQSKESFIFVYVFDVCVTVHHRYNNINSQLDATITNLIDNYNQLNTFRAIISRILRSARLCLQLVV